MTKLYVTITGAKASVEKTGPITTGMVGVPVECTFDEAWEGLNRLVVFRCGEVTKDNSLEAGQTQVPHEVLTRPDQVLYVGVEGRSMDGALVIPTVWAEAGRVLSGAQAANDPALAPTPSQFDRLMEEVADVREEMENALTQGMETAAFVVTLDVSRGMADKTNREIYEAYTQQQCGYLLLVREDMELLLHPVEVTPERAVFAATMGNSGLVVTIADEEISIEICDLATREFVTEQIAKAGLGSNIDLSGYAKKTELPTKVSQLENDSKYLTAVPDGYAKTTDIPKNPGDIGAQPAGNYALKSEIPAVPVQSVNGKTGAVQLSASDVGARPSTWTPGYSDVGADKSGTATLVVSTHNTHNDAHNDIRLLIAGLTTRLDALANSDDDTLDQMAEIVAYIKDNRDLIDQITTGKVSVTDIINNLTTNVTNKPLSAAQGVALKALIDAITVPTKLSQLTEDAAHRTVTDTEKSAWNAKSDFSGNYADLSGKPTIPTVPAKVSAFNNDAGYITGYTETDPTVPNWAKAASKPSYSKSEVGLGNVENVKQYSASNPPPYPVTKVNNKTGAVTLSAADVGAVPTTQAITVTGVDSGGVSHSWTMYGVAQ